MLILVIYSYNPEMPAAKLLLCHACVGGNFRSLESKDKQQKEENTEFQQQREATIAEIQRTKEQGSQQRIKSLVGSKQACVA